MDDTPRPDQDRSEERPATSRIYDFLLGGASNFAADRAAGGDVVAVVPGAPEAARPAWDLTSMVAGDRSTASVVQRRR